MELKYLKAYENFDIFISVDKLNLLIESKESITDGLLEVLDYTIENAESLCVDSSFLLHLLSMYLLAYFSEKRAYIKIITIAKLPGNIINPLLEDTITEGLSNIIASVYDGDLAPIKSIIENRESDTYVRLAALDSMIALVANRVVDREEIVCYFRELYNEKIHLLSEDIIECLIDKSIEIHPKGLEKEINKANDGDVLGYSSPEIDYRLETQAAKSVEDVLDELKAYSLEAYSQYRLVSKEDVHKLAKWLGNTDDRESYENYNHFEYGSNFDEEDLNIERTTTVRSIEKVGRNNPCPCGSVKKYKKCCGK